MQTPNKQWCRSYPTTEEIKSFIEEMEQFKIPVETRNLFRAQAARPADWRLAINLKTFLGLLVLNEVESVLVEGLLPEEREALVALDRAGLSVRSREIAHGLLSVHERWVVLRATVKHFREARAFSRTSMLPDPKLLDEELGQ